MLNMKPYAEKIIKWIQNKVKESGTTGVVIGLSGGIDSAVTAVLCKKALKKETVLAIQMDCYSNPQDGKDANILCNLFDIQCINYNLKNTYDIFKKNIIIGNKIINGNIKSRLRMVTLYYYANYYNLLVCGTTNKTEYLVGYCTKYGDGGVDIEPIMGLYKTEIKELAKYLDIPQSIIDKAPSGGLWEGQTDEKELGITYEKLDKILMKFVTDHYCAYGNYTTIDEKLVSNLIKKSEHKRKPIPLCEI